MIYKFKFKRGFFFKSYLVVGHRYDQGTDKMVMYFQNGGIKEIPKWKECELHLDVDWVLAVKKHMEEQAGTTVPVKPV